MAAMIVAQRIQKVKVILTLYPTTYKRFELLLKIFGAIFGASTDFHDKFGRYVTCILEGND